METILLVDDEESILEVAGEYFTLKGYEVHKALNGRDAVEVLAAHRIDCCFTDINMPEMDGLELAEHIRNIDNSIPVIIMTGYPSLENTIRTLKNGVVDFLDISAVVEKFKNTHCATGGPGVPRKARADLINSTVALPKPDNKIDFVDISYCVDAFRGAAASLPGPSMTDPCE